MTPIEVWAIVDFWAGLPWPMSRAEAQQRAVDRLGWTIEVEDGRWVPGQPEDHAAGRVHVRHRNRVIPCVS